MYVGKAKSLRKRVSSYFTKDLAPRTRAMVDSSDSVDWIITETEVAALLLEYSLIKEHLPRFNIRLKDDKSYPYLAITRSDEWPRARVMRGSHKKGTQYFGPFAHAYAIRNTLDLLLKSLPIRTCSDAVFRRHELKGRPCIEYDIEKCSAPCVGFVDQETYSEYVDGMAALLTGSSEELLARLTRRMSEASDAQEYERAGRVRDQISNVRKAASRQEVVSDRPENFDLIALDESDLEASVQVLKVRRGRIIGRLGTVIDKVEDLTTSELIATLLRDLYTESSPPPREVLVEALPPDVELWVDVLSQRKGSAVSVRVPQRGVKTAIDEDRPNQRQGGVCPASSQAAVRSQRPCQGSAEPGRGAGSPRTTPPDRGVRHLHHPGVATPSLRWSCWRTVCLAEVTTGGSRSARWRGKTTSPRWKRRSDGVSLRTSKTWRSHRARGENSRTRHRLC